MDFQDARKKRVVYVSQCMLNQNLRFPGIAVAAGVCAEVIDLFVTNGIGIEPIPCLERLGWGGVSRKAYFRFQPVILKYVGTPSYRLIRPLVWLWLFRYRLLCEREARKIARQMADYINSGYWIIGIVAANDSPTDGVTRTIDMATAAERLSSLGVDPGVMSNPRIELMRTIIPRLCTEGMGIFTAALKHVLEKKKIPIRIFGYDPWGDQGEEAKRIAGELGL